MTNFLSKRTGNPVLIVLALLGGILFTGTMTSVGGYALLEMGAKVFGVATYILLGVGVTAFNLFVLADYVLTADQKNLVENVTIEFFTKLLWLVEATVVAVGAYAIAFKLFGLPVLISGAVAVLLCLVVGLWRYVWNWGDVKVVPQPGD